MNGGDFQFNYVDNVLGAIIPAGKFLEGTVLGFYVSCTCDKTVPVVRLTLLVEQDAVGKMVLVESAHSPIPQCKQTERCARIDVLSTESSFERVWTEGYAVAPYDIRPGNRIILKKAFDCGYLSAIAIVNALPMQDRLMMFEDDEVEEAPDEALAKEAAEFTAAKRKSVKVLPNHKPSVATVVGGLFTNRQRKTK
jgi:hypothetical protein